jgi:hypothetical protein
MGMDQGTFISQEGAKISKEIRRGQELIITWISTADDWS